jgi:hypothetical protein
MNLDSGCEIVKEKCETQRMDLLISWQRVNSNPLFRPLLKYSTISWSFRIHMCLFYIIFVVAMIKVLESWLWIWSRPLREYHKLQGHNHQIRNVVDSTDWNHRIRPFNFYREVVELYDKIVIFLENQIMILTTSVKAKSTSWSMSK